MSLHRLLFWCCCGLIAPASLADHVGEFEIPWVVPLDQAERHALQQLIETDAHAARRFAEIEAVAKPLMHRPATPLEGIAYEGLVNTNPERIEAVRHLKQMGDAAQLLRYHQATDDPDAAATLRSWVHAWATTYRITGNDVNENKLCPLLIAYIDLRDTFNAAERDAIDTWFQELGARHVDAAQHAAPRTNRFTKHLRIATLCGLALDRAEWIDAAREGARRFVDASLKPDGTSLDLEQRDTLTYHASALKPLIELSMLFERHGGSDNRRDNAPLFFWEASDGASVARSVDYVVPFATGERTRREWVHSVVDLDRRRAEAGLEHYRRGRWFRPEEATELLDLASYYRPDLTPLVARLAGAPPEAQRFPTWLSLNHAAIRAARDAD